MQLAQHHHHHQQLQQHNPVKLVYPPSSLQQTTIENAKRIHHLEHLIRAERQELDRLLIQTSSSSNKRIRHPISSSSPPTTPPALLQTTPQASPKGIMYPYQTQDRKPPVREMAARGSHWSFVEKARFEAALHKYGPFAWEQIIRTVGTRSEKQVKAYAARYRRRKKLAAKAQLEAAEQLPIQKPTPLRPSVVETIQQPLRLPPASTEQSAASSDKPTLLEPVQVDSLLTGEETNVDETTNSFCDGVFADSSLFDTPLVDNTVELPDVNPHAAPSDVELLVDRALQGEFEIEEKTAQEREAEALEDGYPTDFINTVFTH